MDRLRGRRWPDATRRAHRSIPVVLALAALCATPSGALSSTATAGFRSSAVHALVNATPLLSGWWRIPTPGPAPSNRTGGQMAYDSEDQYVVLFGGCPGYLLAGSCGTPLNDTWAYWGGNWSEIPGGGGPPARAYGALADDPALGAVVLFGGESRNGTLNDTWEFTAGTWTELHPAASPPALKQAAMGYDPADSELVLEGGLASGSLSASFGTWVFTGTTWENETGTVHPPGWLSPFLSVDPSTQGLVLVGGTSAVIFPTYSTECWTFKANVWTNDTAASSIGAVGSRWLAIGGFDPIRNTTYLFGGDTGVSVGGGLWSFGLNGTWAPMESVRAPPGAFYASQGAFDAWDGYLFDFGRANLGSFFGLSTIQNVTNETWSLLTGLDLNNTTAPTSVVVGTGFNVSGNASGGFPPYTYNWSFGDGKSTTAFNETHVYSRTGTYNLSLTVKDLVGQVSVVRYSVAVSAAPSPLASSLSPTSPVLWVLVAVVAAGLGLVYVVRRRRRPPTDSPVPMAPTTPTVEGSTASPDPGDLG